MFKPYPGGKNNPAPYQTTHLRVPLPIKPYLEKLATTYKFAVRMQDEKVVEQFIKSLKRFVSNYKPVGEEPLESLYTPLYEELEDYKQKLELASNTVYQLQSDLDLVRLNNKEAKAILNASLELKQIRANAVKKEVERALKLID